MIHFLFGSAKWNQPAAISVFNQENIHFTGSDTFQAI